MSQVTQTYKRTFSGSVGAGIGSLIGASGRQYYLLEHRISSRYHRMGETQEIIVDEIEIGRDQHCQVRFDETFTTVSRRHAAIVREGDKWKLVNLSATNPTFLNGNKIGKEWYLQNGDEIQLSIGGPKLGFLASGKTTGSLPLGVRGKAFVQQALRPYKTIIIWLVIAFLLALAALTAWKLHSDRTASEKIDVLTVRADSLETVSKAQYDRFQEQQDSIANIVKKSKIDNKKMQAELEKLKKRVRIAPSPSIESPSAGKKATVGATIIDNAAVEACLPYIYFIYLESIEVLAPNKERYEINNNEIFWSATGFLLDDGRLVTARHVVEPWYFSYTDTLKVFFNLAAHNGGKVVAHFTAISSSGDRLHFTNEEAICHRTSDKSVVTEDGYKLCFSNGGDNDWAYIRTARRNGLKFDKQGSASLNRGVELTVLGFPLGLGANAANDIKPIWGHAVTASEGLNQGVILTTDTNFEHGSSGGPALYTDSEGDLVVVGIVSAGAGRSTGFIVPISSIY